ncbi:hypothetical protein LT85_3857 [Collimonas arenae]|uniref:Uncharacterized protein n=1 Tax=Collimonas arenae TaxID=279058 RepID=A0A0A1FH63_9BURK|nr:hypothetical protein [Collimonas arenae]AIY43015.1 hypothetical protein LT85_3857 [Collimonas arenae]
MSQRLYFCQLTQIKVGPVKTLRHPDPAIGIYSTQKIVFHFEGGNTQELTLDLETGAHALALGECITNAEVNA